MIVCFHYSNHIRKADLSIPVNTDSEAVGQIVVGEQLSFFFKIFESI